MNAHDKAERKKSRVEVSKIRDETADALARAENDTPETRELIARRGLQRIAQELWPDLVACGVFDFIRSDLEAMYEAHVRENPDGSTARGKRLSIEGLVLRATAGYAISMLRTETPSRKRLSKAKAEETVAGWTQGLLKPNLARQWTVAFGDVKNAGEKAERAEEDSAVIGWLLPYFEAHRDAPSRWIEARVREATKRARDAETWL